MTPCFARLSLLVAILVSASLRLEAQCSNSWLPSVPVAGVIGAVSACTAWDPDGAGPATERFVFGGSFTAAGSVSVSNVATFDPTTSNWGPLGVGLNAPVSALAARPTGELYAAGSFTTSGGTTVNGVASWNGSTWVPLGSGLAGLWWFDVNALVVLPNGDLVAGGFFSTAGGAPAANIARWDGIAWSALGSGVNSRVTAMAALPNGDVIVGGYFSTAGGAQIHRVARWDGANWHSLGFPPTPSNASVTSLATTLNGDVIASLSFGVMQGGGYILRGSSGTWQSLTGGASWIDAPNAVRVLANGAIVAAAGFDFGGNVYGAVAQWNGTSWQPVGPSGSWYGEVNCLAEMSNGPLACGGYFKTAGGTSCQGAAMWDGAAWHSLGPGLGRLRALALLPNGDVVIGGEFTNALGVGANRIARWDGSAWNALGTGLDGEVLALAVMPNGDLVAGGQFLQAGGASANFVARWNGSVWLSIGTGLSPNPATAWSPGVRALLAMPNGDLIAGGEFDFAGGTPATNIARWDGTTWHSMASTLTVKGMTTTTSGDIVITGESGTLRWTGSNWQLLFAGGSTITRMPNGDLVVGGDPQTQTQLGGFQMHRWDGIAATALPGTVNLDVSSLQPLPNGDLLVGGTFQSIGGVGAVNVARWTGSWQAVGTGTDAGVLAMLAQPNGDVLVAGSFLRAGNNPSAYLARLTTTCPATAVALGAGCTGSGGANVLTATSLPWIGSTFTATATGMPAFGIALRALGLTTASIPLAAILPQGTAGCALLVSPDLIDFHLPVAGAVPTAIAIPNTIALANQTLHQQVGVFELDALGGIIALTSTNALTLTIGAF